MAEKIRSREEIAREDTWAMEDLYASDEAWLEDLEKLKLLGRNRVDVTIGSALDLFGGRMSFETVVLLSHKKPDRQINVKVEFGEGEGKVPLDNIAKRAEEASDSGESGSHKGCVEAF